MHSNPVNPTDGSTAFMQSDCVAHADTTHTTTITQQQATSNTYPATLGLWSSAAASDPDCVPAETPCTSPGWWMCYSLWPETADPAPLVVDYRACDARFDAFNRAGTPAQAAGRTEDDYCDAGTITVVLGTLPTVTISAPAPATEGSPLQFPVTLSAAAVVDVTVTFSTQPDTAGTDPAEASDYLASTNAAVVIPAGQIQATASVFTTQDSIYEDDETLRVILTGADLAHLGATTEAVGTIANDDSPPVLSFAGDVTAVEDDGTTGGALTFTVGLVGATELQARVAYATAPGTATGTTACPAAPGNPVQDYVTDSGSLTFAPGDTSKTITVAACLDDQNEGDETFTVTLTSPIDATLGTASATGTIDDNDAPPLTPNQQCELLHGPGWAAVLYPDDTPWTDSFGQIVCAMPH